VGKREPTRAEVIKDWQYIFSTYSGTLEKRFLGLMETPANDWTKDDFDYAVAVATPLYGQALDESLSASVVLLKSTLEALPADDELACRIKQFFEDVEEGVTDFHVRQKVAALVAEVKARLQ